MVTIYDIAKKTGFSITTVSRALNNYSDVSEKTKKLILQAVDEMGYYPNSIARTLTTKKSWTIGVIFVEDLGVGIMHPFFSAVIESFKKYVEKFGYDIIFLSRNVGGEEKSYIDHALHRGVDGVIIVCSHDDDPEVKKLIESPLQTVVIDLYSNKTSVVYSDNVNGSELAVQYLHSLGHRKIAHIYGHQKTMAGVERLKGFLSVVEKLQLNIPDSYIKDGSFFSVDGGMQAMSELLELGDPPTAVFAAGDAMAIGAMKAVEAAGLRVPEDVSIVGFDDIELAQYVTPALTTIRQNTDLIGQSAAEVLLKQINNKNKVFSAVTIPVELMVRESARPLKPE
ncbi:LacI family transcriptional regulator [Evansella caseinilytica]|uniref:LacI family transcriptional regulator n=1 Tax=Evansella caseinilytica TaxID=1503961 RepID=A0A1H3GPC7_9BACI|nr:LacI family DNA-binding transcriptional regulator [Evansella caseinilytica]SDY04179.1 LacI family transcriptional regulator [Evansella caseinilytica]